MKAYVAMWESPVGKRYISKSANKKSVSSYPNDPDPKVYCGSGVYWTKHIKKHGLPVLLDIIWCEDESEALEFENLWIEECDAEGLDFSEYLNIKSGGEGSFPPHVQVMGHKACLIKYPDSNGLSENFSELGRRKLKILHPETNGACPELLRSAKLVHKRNKEKFPETNGANPKWTKSGYESRKKICSIFHKSSGVTYTFSSVKEMITILNLNNSSLRNHRIRKTQPTSKSSLRDWKLIFD